MEEEGPWAAGQRLREGLALPAVVELEADGNCCTEELLSLQ